MSKQTHDELIERGKHAAEDLIEEGLSAYARDIDALIAELQRKDDLIESLAREKAELW
jgi:hypothetical protein